MTNMEEAKEEGLANQQTENNLSSVKIIKNSKGYNWEIKVKHIDPYVAMEVSQIIDSRMQERYK